MSVERYVMHLAEDDDPARTVCGEPWQRWQVGQAPGPLDKIHQCQACYRRAREMRATLPPCGWSCAEAPGI